MKERLCTVKNWVVALMIFMSYVLLQIASIFLAPELIVYFTGKGLSKVEAVSQGFAWTLFITQGVAALIIAAFLLRNKKFLPVFKGKPSGFGSVLLWGVLGFFLAMAGQIVGAAIESVFGVTAGSENTELLSNISKTAPIIIFAMVLFAPFLEEVVFRRIIFGGLYTKTNFWVAAIVSAIVFAAVHGELQHLLMYLMPGLAFAFVYYKTKRLLTPMIAHFLMNSFVTVVQWNADKLQQLQDMQQSIVLFLQ
ncbi:CPBP family intramembrane metalloprotease [Sporosarcina sp. P21c]|nr:CPBP family intramembrane metalloprotease [Sporosarcina sp. P16a]PIC89733.1 CPBP family intramembrane metalloprotease [Sporosarcina sp. P21c]PIC92929.1 CPBP family intramembrane metalloprotease [Sporosarcina sp. P25]